jgi:hypothetical protein
MKKLYIVSVMNGFIDKLGMREFINRVDLETDSFS